MYYAFSLYFVVIKHDQSAKNKISLFLVLDIFTTTIAKLHNFF